MGLDPVDGVIRVSLVHYNTGKFVVYGDQLTLELTKPQRTRLSNSSKCWMRYSPTRLLNTYNTTVNVYARYTISKCKNDHVQKPPTLSKPNYWNIVK